MAPADTWMYANADIYPSVAEWVGTVEEEASTNDDIVCDTPDHTEAATTYIVLFVGQDPGTADTPEITTPTGWTCVMDNVGSGADQPAALCYIASDDANAPAESSGTVTITFAAASSQRFCWAGEVINVHSSTPVPTGGGGHTLAHDSGAINTPTIGTLTNAAGSGNLILQFIHFASNADTIDITDDGYTQEETWGGDDGTTPGNVGGSCDSACDAQSMDIASLEQAPNTNPAEVKYNNSSATNSVQAAIVFQGGS